MTDITVFAELSKAAKNAVAISIYLVLIALEYFFIMKARSAAKEAKTAGEDNKVSKKVIIYKSAAAFIACGAISYIIFGGLS
ncbi:MAG: hypothetical protein IKO44_00350 [Ruminococcus sp.]|nr:hypothetical protein [Ruminococcus sp.]